jgi:chemotaxis protein CheD
MAHVMLPDSSLSKTVTNRGKFADTSIPDLTARLIQMGTLVSRLVAKIAGGSQMFAFMGNDDKLLIGPRNVAAVEKALKEQGIKLTAKNVGGSAGRSVLFDLASGKVTIKTLNSSDIIL